MSTDSDTCSSPNRLPGLGQGAPPHLMKANGTPSCPKWELWVAVLYQAWIGWVTVFEVLSWEGQWKPRACSSALATLSKKAWGWLVRTIWTLDLQPGGRTGSPTSFATSSMRALTMAACSGVRFTT